MKLNLVSVALAAALCTTTPAAFAINKCIGPTGSVVFQDAPCMGSGGRLNVRPASGDAPAPAGEPAATPSAPEAKPQTEAQRIEKQIAESQKDRRRRELRERLIPDASQAINHHRAQCDSQLKALQARKSLANNNLAGATWEASISSEMSAISTQCDTQNRSLRADLDALRK